MSDIKQTIVEIVAKTAKAEPDSINDDTRLTEDLKLKSVDKISISALASTSLGVSITMFDILKVKTVADIVALAESKMKK